jgi:hypothetical protein
MAASGERSFSFKSTDDCEWFGLNMAAMRNKVARAAYDRLT